MNDDSSCDTPVNFRFLPAYRKCNNRACAFVSSEELNTETDDHANISLLSQDGAGQLLSPDLVTPEGLSSLTSTVTSVNKATAVTYVASFNRKRKCIELCKRFAAFLLSTVGLTMLTIAYAIAGGYLFSALEAGNEQQVKSDVRHSLEWHVDALWNRTAQLNVLHPVNWSQLAESILSNYTLQVFKATKNEGWDGHIRYGHIAPKTACGRLATIVYAVFGIPLTLLTIAHVGSYMAAVFRCTYKNFVCALHGAACCCSTPTHVTRDVTHDALHSDAAELSSSNQGQSEHEGHEVELKVKDVVNMESANGETVEVTAIKESGRDEDDDDVQRRPTRCRCVRHLARRLADVLLRMRTAMASCTRNTDDVHVPLYVSLLILAGYILVGSLLFGLWEPDWNVLVGSYFCFVTLSTIGFGDFVPGTSLDAWSSTPKLVLCSLYVVCGLALLAMCFDLMQAEVRHVVSDVGRRLGLIQQQQEDSDVTTSVTPTTH